VRCRRGERELDVHVVVRNNHGSTMRPTCCGDSVGILKKPCATSVSDRCASSRRLGPSSLRCYSVFIQERAVLSNAQSKMDLARLTREWAYFDSRTIALHD
jgi:hypothetical protein